MSSKDQQLLEEAYWEVANQVKDLYNQIKPLAEKILGAKKEMSWDLDEEDKQSEFFSHFTQFALKRIIINAGSPTAYPSIEFGNLHGGQLWGNELSPHATTPKKYAAILKVLQKKIK
jgi:hypothetical protein